MNMPTLFVSHGAPTLVMDPVPSRDFLVSLGKQLPRPRAILMVSAHWESFMPQVSGAARPPMIYDFSGFPQELYRMNYPAPGDPLFARRVADLLIATGLSVRIDPARGFDHGAWVPLKLMFPEADIPVVQLSVETRRGAAFHVEIGRTLQPLRSEGVLIIGSGAATHNLGEFRGQPIDSPVAEYVRRFDAWLEKAVTAGDEESLVRFEQTAPEPRRVHPTEDHFLPLFVPLGAAGPGAKGRKIHSSFTFGILSMAAYQWD